MKTYVIIIMGAIGAMAEYTVMGDGIQMESGNTLIIKDMITVAVIPSGYMIIEKP